MPLTYEEKKQKVIAAGLNPDEYTFDDSVGSSSEAQPNQPVDLYAPFNQSEAEVQGPPVPPKISGFQAFKNSGLRSLIPSAAALTGLRLGAQGGAAIGSMFPGPGTIIGGGVGGLLGGLGGSYLGGLGQEKVLEKVQGPEAYQQGLGTLNQGREQHQILAAAGELAPMAPFLGSGGVLKELSKIVQPSTISGQTLAKAIVPGLLASGMEGSRQYLTGEQFDPLRIATYGAVGGALQNSPTRLGAKVLGVPFHGPSAIEKPPVGTREFSDPVIEAPVSKEPVIEPLPQEQVVKPQPQPDQEIIRELQGQEVKPSLENNQSPVVKAGEQPNRPQVEEGYISDPGEKFYQPALKEGETNEPNPILSNEAKNLASRRSVQLEQQPEIISSETGQPARGISIPSERKAITSDIATSDTPYHEIGGHQHVEDLLSSKLESDRKFAERGVSAAGSKEKLAESIGKRIVDIENKPLKTWLEDFYSNTKRIARLGGKAEDDINLLARRARDDRPYIESPELHKDLNEFTTKFYSEDTGVSPTTATSKEPSKGIGPFTSLVDRIAEKGPTGVKVARAISQTDHDNVRLNGKITNSFIENAKKIKEGENAVRYIWESNNGEPITTLNTADKALVDGPLLKTYREVHQIQRDYGLKINGRDAIDNPRRRGPNIVSKQVLDTIIQKPENDVKRQALIKDFIDRQIKTGEAKNLAEAKEHFNDMLVGFSPAAESSTSHFNALRKAEGHGIPWSWMEKNPVELFKRYGSRVSRDLAYYKNIESNPEISAMMGLTKQEGVEPITYPEVKTAQKRLTGQHTTNETLYNSIEHFVRGLILGPVTGVKNTISTFAQILPYVPSRDLGSVVKAFSYIKKGFVDSMEMGVNRHSITSMEIGDINGIGRLGNTLTNLGDIARKYSGANAIEQWTRAHNMALGEILTQSYWGRAAKGDIDAVRFLKKFAPEINPKTTPLTEGIIKETAANFVERVQGTYGARGLPGFLLEPSSPAYWFMSLAKWSVEKSNVIKQDVINPALKGEDYGPLLRYALGGLLTGEVVREVGEALMGGKKSQSPDLKELQAKGGIDDYAYKFFELSSLAGLGGFVMDVAKAGMDLHKGYNTRGYNIPSYEIAKDLTGEIGAASAAINEGQNPLEVIFQLGLNIVTDNVQAVRIFSNAANPDEIDRLNKFRDKRVYDQSKMDRYGGMAEREFKRSKTVEDAKEVYEDKLKPKLEPLDRTARREELSKLRRNSYQTVPSGSKERRDYLSYIEETQGSEAAKELLADKKRQDLVNRRKNSLLRH